MDAKTLEMTGRTRLIGVMADPVAQARAIDVGNALLSQRGQSGDFVVVPLQVDADGLDSMIRGLRVIKNMAGTMVSMPHKQLILPFLDSCTPEAELGRAVNVVRRTAEGKLEGHLLDGEGFVAGLVNAGHTVRGAICLLAGAGGAASAIALALARNGCKALTIVNRTQSKADEVAARVRELFPHTEVRAKESGFGQIDIAINGTSLGMRSGDALPFDVGVVRRSRLVAECVIAPDMTQLLLLAQQQGCEVHVGVHMLRAQIVDLLDYMGASAP